jgi:hypothetical protein
VIKKILILFIPSAVNAAGTQRLQDGTKIVGAIKAKRNNSNMGQIQLCTP